MKESNILLLEIFNEIVKMVSSPDGDAVSSGEGPISHLSSCTLLSDEKRTKKERKFVIHQELAELIINTFLLNHDVTPALTLLFHCRANVGLNNIVIL